MSWKDRGFRPHAVSIIAKGVMKRRLLPNGTVHQFRFLRRVFRVHIRFLRNGKLGWRIGKGAEDRLASNDDQFARVRDAARGADQMFKITSCHYIDGKWPSVPGE